MFTRVTVSATVRQPTVALVSGGLSVPFVSSFLIGGSSQGTVPIQKDREMIAFWSFSGFGGRRLRSVGSVFRSGAVLPDHAHIPLATPTSGTNEHCGQSGGWVVRL